MNGNKFSKNLSGGPGRYSLPAILGIYAFVGFTAVRIILALMAESAPFADNLLAYAKSFAFGAVNDVAVSILFAIVVSPLFLLTAKIDRKRKRKFVSIALFIAVAIALSFGFVAEIFFWNEFDARFNGVAVFYLMFPREVIGNLQESFNLAAYMPAFAIAGILLWAITRSLHHIPENKRSWTERGLRLLKAGVIGAIALAVLVLQPRHPFANREIDELAHNGLQTFFTAALTNDARYAGVYPGLPKDEAVSYLHKLIQQDNTTFIDDPSKPPTWRHVVNPGPERHLNVVLVREESYGSLYMDDLDSRWDIPISGELTDIARQSLYFTNIYASGDRSVRGLEATETSFAPIPGISTARRDGSVGMYSLPHFLGSRGYNTGMLYAGLNVFDNMGDYWRGIGWQHVWDQRDFHDENGFKTIWGYSDEDLFTEALSRMDELTKDGKPALLGMFTVSNHRPYEFPQDKVKWNDNYGRKENSAHFAAWSFVDFLKRAKDKPWFKDTVFVFVADHSVKVNGAARIPVHAFRIPMFFYSPAHIKPQTVPTLGAQIDLIPTLLGQLNMTYDSPFFGVDLMRVPPDKGRIAISHNFGIAFGMPGHLVVMEPNGKTEGYAFHPGDPELKREEPDPETLKYAIGQTQEAHRAFYAHHYHWTPAPVAAK